VEGIHSVILNVQPVGLNYILGISFINAHKEFEQLKDDGWRSFSEFGGYLRAVDGMKEMGDVSKGGCEYFDKMPPVFLEKFEETFAEHTKKLRRHVTLPVIIAGHQQITTAFTRWLLGSENNMDAAEEAELVHHYTGSTTPTINVKECIN
jgi:hypothetical protein